MSQTEKTSHHKNNNSSAEQINVWIEQIQPLFKILPMLRQKFLEIETIEKDRYNKHLPLSYQDLYISTYNAYKECLEVTIALYTELDFAKSKLKILSEVFNMAEYKERMSLLIREDLGTSLLNTIKEESSVNVVRMYLGSYVDRARASIKDYNTKDRVKQEKEIKEKLELRRLEEILKNTGNTLPDFNSSPNENEEEKE